MSEQEKYIAQLEDLAVLLDGSSDSVIVLVPASTTMQNAIDNVRLKAKIVMHDLESTRRENNMLRAIVDELAEQHEDGEGEGV